jgi:hypothetical protein
MIRGHRLEQIVDAGLAPSVRWLQDQIRAQRIPAHKIGRHWVMTDTDLEAALEVWASKPDHASALAAPFPLSLTATSQRRRVAS